MNKYLTIINNYFSIRIQGDQLISNFIWFWKSPSNVISHYWKCSKKKTIRIKSNFERSQSLERLMIQPSVFTKKKNSQWKSKQNKFFPVPLRHKFRMKPFAVGWSVNRFQQKKTKRHQLPIWGYMKGYTHYQWFKTRTIKLCMVDKILL